MSRAMSTFQGYATHFDIDSNQWIHLSEELCFIELSVPPAIHLSNAQRIPLYNIELKGFQHQSQAATSVMISTQGVTGGATSQMYGFRFADEETTHRFEASLVGLSQYYRYESNFISHKSPPKPSSHPSLNPFQTMDPNMHKKGQPSVFPLKINSLHEDASPFGNRDNTPSTCKPRPIFQNFVADNRPGNAPNKFDTGPKINSGYENKMKLNGFINEHSTSEHMPLTDEEKWCNRLSEEIDAGNINAAEDVVAKLAGKMSKVVITPLVPKKTEFNILIQIHDKNEQAGGTVITESLDPYNTSIAMLKYRMYMKYQFPMDIQLWIINKSLAKDTDTLAKCGVKATGTTIFLYLKSVKLQNSKTPKPATSHDKQVQTEENLTNFLSSQLKNQTNNQQEFIHQACYIEPKQNPGNLQATNAGSQPRNATNVVQERLGWDCPKCTFKNLPTFEGCTLCMETRPVDYKIPQNYVMLPEEVERIANEKRNEELLLNFENQRKAEEEMAAQENYRHILQAMDQKLLPNQEEFECSICMDEVEKGEGVMLRDCLHSFCKECLVGTIVNSEDPEVRCPYNDGFACLAVITMQEIEELLPHEEYGKYLSKSLHAAERGAKDSFHCRSSNCIGWCFFEDDVNNFVCPICGQNNCLTCKAIHPDQSCKDYQDDLKIRAENDDAAKKTQAMLDELITRGEAMHCPQCQVILQKKQGCDWMRCTMCRCEICWATKGARWGAGGNGDTSGGCKCGVNGRRCAPNCGNCH